MIETYTHSPEFLEAELAYRRVRVTGTRISQSLPHVRRWRHRSVRAA